LLNKLRKSLYSRKGGVISIGLILIAWEISSRFSPPYLIPSLKTIFESFSEVVFHWSLLQHAFVTVGRVLLALVMSFFIGGVLSTLMGFFKKLEDYILPVLHLIMGVPALSWVVFSIIWFPEVETRIQFILIACCMPNYTLELHDGIKGISEEQIDMLSSFRPTRIQLFTKLILPSIVPSILTSWKINVGYAVRVAMVAELVGATAGVGYQLLSSQERFDMPGAISWTLVLVVFLQLSQYILKKSEMRFLRYRPVRRAIN